MGWSPTHIILLGKGLVMANADDVTVVRHGASVPGTTLVNNGASIPVMQSIPGQRGASVPATQAVNQPAQQAQAKQADSTGDSGKTQGD